MTGSLRPNRFRRITMKHIVARAAGTGPRSAPFVVSGMAALCVALAGCTTLTTPGATTGAASQPAGASDAHGTQSARPNAAAAPANATAPKPFAEVIKDATETTGLFH